MSPRKIFSYLSCLLDKGLIRDSLVMANYEQKEYLTRIITDAILGIKNAHESVKSNSENKESYRIAKSDYDAFKAKYSVKK